MLRLPPATNLVLVATAAAAARQRPRPVPVGGAWPPPSAPACAGPGWRWPRTRSGWALGAAGRDGRRHPGRGVGAGGRPGRRRRARRARRGPPAGAGAHLARPRRRHRAGPPGRRALRPDRPCPTLEALAWGDLLAADRARDRAGWPPVEVVDRRDEDPRRAGLFSAPLVRLLRSDRRVLCVLNRTGRARLLACAACGELARCAPLRGGRRAARGRRCAARGAAPTDRRSACTCGGTRFKNVRAGVTRVREELEALVGEPVAEVTATSERGHAPVSRWWSAPRPSCTGSTAPTPSPSSTSTRSCSRRGTGRRSRRWPSWRGPPGWSPPPGRRAVERRATSSCRRGRPSTRWCERWSTPTCSRWRRPSERGASCCGSRRTAPWRRSPAPPRRPSSSALGRPAGVEVAEAGDGRWWVRARGPRRPLRRAGRGGPPGGPPADRGRPAPDLRRGR